MTAMTLWSSEIQSTGKVMIFLSRNGIVGLSKVRIETNGPEYDQQKTQIRKVQDS